MIRRILVDHFKYLEMMMIIIIFVIICHLRSLTWYQCKKIIFNNQIKKQRITMVKK